MNGPATLKFEQAGSPPLQARIQSRYVPGRTGQKLRRVFVVQHPRDAADQARAVTVFAGGDVAIVADRRARR